MRNESWRWVAAPTLGPVLAMVQATGPNIDEDAPRSYQRRAWWYMEVGSVLFGYPEKQLTLRTQQPSVFETGGI